MKYRQIDEGDVEERRLGHLRRAIMDSLSDEVVQRMEYERVKAIKDDKESSSENRRDAKRVIGDTKRRAERAKAKVDRMLTKVPMSEEEVAKVTVEVLDGVTLGLENEHLACIVDLEVMEAEVESIEDEAERDSAEERVAMHRDRIRLVEMTHALVVKERDVAAEKLPAEEEPEAGADS